MVHLLEEVRASLQGLGRAAASRSRVMKPGQIIATSHDLTPKGS